MFIKYTTLHFDPSDFKNDDYFEIEIKNENFFSKGYGTNPEVCKDEELIKEFRIVCENFLKLK